MFTWWRHLSAFAKLVGIIGVTSGAVVSTAAAWPLVEWLFPAHRGHVSETVRPLIQVMDKAAIAVDRQSIIILKGQLNEAKRDPAAPTSPIVKERIEEIEKEIDTTTKRVKRSIELSK